MSNKFNKINKTSIIAFLIVIFLFYGLLAQAADFRFGFEYGWFFPIDSSLYDGRDSLQFPEIKEGIYWPNGWGVEFSQRLISPQNRFLSYGVRTSPLEPRGDDRFHLRYNLPLTISLRYDFQKDRKALFHPYLAAGIGLYYTSREFERIRPPLVIDKVDRQTPIGPLFTAGLEILRTNIKITVEFRYEIFHLKETFSGSGDDGIGGGASLGIGVIF